ncbi:MAG: helix-turn-helix domain-containing protein, partial [Pseudonocardiaceae bacterium]
MREHQVDAGMLVDVGDRAQVGDQCPEGGSVIMSEVDSGWLQRDMEPAGDDAGAVLLAWRGSSGCTQTEVAGVLGTTQQHLSQIETGQRPISLELRRKIVAKLGIAAEDLGLSCGSVLRLGSRD